MGKPDHWGGCQNYTADERCNVKLYRDRANPGMFGDKNSALGQY